MEQNSPITVNPGFFSNENEMEASRPPPNTKEPSENMASVRTMQQQYSQPKFKSYKEQVLKIPKVKQILNKDKYVYSQDIEKRLELIGTLKNENYIEEQKYTIDKLRKPLQKTMPIQSKSTTKIKLDKKSSKKTLKRHKTNFKIPLTRNNINQLNEVIVSHISHNQRYKNQEVLFLKQYSQNAPFDLEKLSFMDKIDKIKIKYKEKFPDLNEKVLTKNKLVLQNVILNRNIKRELKLDQKKSEKIHEKNVYQQIQQFSKKKEEKKT